MDLRRVCVYAGSSVGARAAYAMAAADLGAVLARRGIEIVFGGGKVGLMGVLAEAALGQGGRVIGVIPEDLVRREVAHESLSELHVVGSMHERKAMMAELSQAFVALPGGIGTLEELVEMLSWARLGLHRKPCGLLDVGGYYDHFLAFLDDAVAERFLPAEHRALVVVGSDAGGLLDRLASAVH